jgi:hypothetical protein
MSVFSWRENNGDCSARRSASVFFFFFLLNRWIKIEDVYLTEESHLAGAAARYSVYGANAISTKVIEHESESWLATKLPEEDGTREQRVLVDERGHPFVGP